MDKLLLTTKEVAAALGVSRMTVMRWIRAGVLPSVKLGHRTVRVHRDEVHALAERGTPRSVR